MAESSSEYHHGEMDIRAQQDTYKGFLKLTKWGSLALAVTLAVLVVWFCTPAGFLPGLIAGVALTAIGVVVLREKPAPAH